MSLTFYGKTIRALRIIKHVTLADMSKAIGVRPAYLSSVEHGRIKPDVDFFQKVEDFFESLGEVTAPDLLGCVYLMSYGGDQKKAFADSQVRLPSYAQKALDKLIRDELC